MDMSPTCPANSSQCCDYSSLPQPKLRNSETLCYIIFCLSVFSEAEACSNESLLSFVLIFKVCYYLEVFICITFAKTSEQRPAHGNKSIFAPFYINRKELIQLVLFFAIHSICL